MSRAQPKSSPTDQHARRIALAIAKGRPPPFSADLDRYCENSRAEILPLSRARLATCLRPARMRRLPSVICFSCSSYSSIYGIAPIGAMRTPPSSLRIFRPK